MKQEERANRAHVRSSVGELTVLAAWPRPDHVLVRWFLLHHRGGSGRGRRSGRVVVVDMSSLWTPSDPGESRSKMIQDRPRTGTGASSPRQVGRQSRKRARQSFRMILVRPGRSAMVVCHRRVLTSRTGYRHRDPVDPGGGYSRRGSGEPQSNAVEPRKVLLAT